MNTQTFEIPVVRISYGYRTITVQAENLEEAQELALRNAGDFEFSEKSSEYNLEDWP